MPDAAAGFRLSPQQRRMWQIGATNPAFQVQCALSIPADVGNRQVRQVFEEAAAREQIFRTRFQPVPGMKTPIQVVGEDVSAQWREIDVGDEGCNPARLLEAERADLVNYERGPLLRASLARRASGEGVLVLSLPSMCADAATMAMLAADIACVVRDPGIPYVQFAEWQNQCAEGDDGRAASARWSDLELPPAEAVQLAFERRTPAGAFAPRFQSRALRAAAIHRLRETCERLGTNAEDVLLACWQVLLATLTQCDEMVVGVIAPGRDHQALAGVCGPIAKATPLRTRFQTQTSFQDLARRVHADVEAHREWGAYYQAKGTETFPFTFSWEVWPDRLSAGHAALAVSARYVCLERFGLHLGGIWIGEQLYLELGHDTARFAASDAHYVGQLLETLLAAALERPDRAVEDLDLLGLETRRAVLSHSTGSVQPIQDESLDRLFEAQVARTSDRLAVIDARAALSYSELDAAANAVARALVSLGAGPDVLIGLLVDRSVEAIAGLLGILKSGAAYVPLDPGQSAERLAALVTGAGIRVLAVQASLVPTVSLADIPVFLLPPAGSAISGADRVAAASPSPQNLAYAVYTSGSTGRPKAVAIEHRSAASLLASLDRRIYLELAGPLRVALNAPLTFDASVKQWLRLLRGDTLCLVPEEVRYDPSAMLDWLERERIEVLDCTPAQLQPLLDAGLREDALPALKAVLVGGEAIDEALWTRLSTTDRIRFYNVYGPTECTVDATACRISKDLDAPVVGRPLDNVETYVLDGRFELVPMGVAGELFIAGAGVARGYVDAPALTAGRFLPNPFSQRPGSRMYRTGDRVRWAGDGQVEFLGRLDRQIKIRGYRVEPGEIEAELREHPTIQAAAVTVETDAAGNRLIAYVVAVDRTSPEESELRSWLRRTLPEFMMPDRIELIDSLPLTRHGKVDYPALPQHAKPLRRVATGLTPRNELERTIADAWRQVLTLDTVGIDDNFFDLGGHSILLAQLYSRLRETLAREFPMMELFRHPTVSSFAAFLGDQADTSFSRDAVLERAARQKQAFRQYDKARAERTS